MNTFAFVFDFACAVCAMAGKCDDKQIVPQPPGGSSRSRKSRKRPASAETKNWESGRKQKRKSVRIDHLEQFERQREAWLR